MTREEYKQGLEYCSKEQLIVMLLEQWDGLTAMQDTLKDQHSNWIPDKK